MTLDLNDPIAVLLAATDALRAGGIPHAAYGGLALAVYGEPRETRDADFAVAGADCEATKAALRSAGLDVSLTFEGVRFGGNRISRFALVQGSDLTTIDLVEPLEPTYASEALNRAVSGTLRSQPVRVLAPEDFVVFKLLSTRDRDLEDARSVIAALDDALDTGLIQQCVARLASTVPEHDLTGRLAAVLPP
jgi:hypothetical protein